jgi:hypothetical protein
MWSHKGAGKANIGRVDQALSCLHFRVQKIARWDVVRATKALTILGARLTTHSKRTAPPPLNSSVRAQMHSVVNCIFYLSIVGFVTTWFVAIYFWVCIRTAIRQHGSFRWQEFSLRGQFVCSHPAASYMRSFMRSILVAAIWWCIGLATGLSSGILQ